MPKLIFSFDTEDFTSEKSADAILDIAAILKEEGLKGCFCLVGLQAKQLVSWGRTDVLDALKHHEVDFHSYGHTLHPTINEYTDIEDYEKAYQEFIRQETLGLSYVRAATGTHHVFGVSPPGNNESYVAMYGYADLGVPCYGAETLTAPHGKDMFICNMRYCRYNISIEEIIWSGLADKDDLYNWLASQRTCVIYNHPNTFEYKEFWDAVNYMGENKHPFGEWEEPPRLTEEERQNMRTQFRKIIRRLKSDGRFTFSTYREIVEEEVNPVRILEPQHMPIIRDALQHRFGPINTPCSLSLADVFQACVHFLRGAKRFHCERAYGFLEEPYAIAAPVTLSAESIKSAAKGIDLSTFLPTSFTVDNIKIGPADMLFAMLDVLCGKTSVTLVPRSQHMNMDEVDGLKDPDLTGWCYSPDYTGIVLTRRLPLQNWTVRYMA